MSYSKYLTSKCFIGYGVINGLINAAIFYLINKSDMQASITFGQALFELALTALLLGMILTWCVVPLTKMDFNKGVYQKGVVCPFCARLTPKAIPLSVIVGIVACVAGSALSALTLACIPVVVTAWTLMIIKGFVCACCGALSGFMVIEAVTGHIDVQ